MTFLHRLRIALGLDPVPRLPAPRVELVVTVFKPGVEPGVVDLSDVGALDFNIDVHGARVHVYKKVHGA